MRFNPQEIIGSRVRLRYSVALDYEIGGPAEFLLLVHAAKTHRQVVVDESFRVEPHRPASFQSDPVSGNRIAAFTASVGQITVRYAAVVDIAHQVVNWRTIVAESPAQLPIATIGFLYASRYCQTDLVQQQAWDMFGRMPRGYAQIAAVREWVQRSLRFQIGVSSSSTSVTDTLRDGHGVCRDFAHVMISFCRALNYPSRFVTGVDYGSDPALGPPDFHAYVEVFVGGAWYLFDPTGISPLTGLMRIGTGHDAADVSFATIFGPVRTGMPRIACDAVEDAGRGFVAPAHTELAVSTA